MSCDSPLIIQLGKIEKPIEWIGQPRLTHSLSKNGHSFSWESPGRLPINWKNTERTKVVIKDKNANILFTGNVVSRQLKGFPNLTTSCNAVGYSLHTRKNIINDRYRGPLATILGQILEASGAKDLITEISYKVGQVLVNNTELISLQELDKDINIQGKYLDEALDMVLGGLASWYIQPASGHLVIYQSPYLNRAAGSINVQQLERGCPGVLSPENVQMDFQSPDISRVIVARQAEDIIYKEAKEITHSVARQIFPDSPERFFKLLDKTNKVIKAVINPVEEPLVCDTLSLDPSSSSFPFNGGSSSFWVLVGDNCSWTAEAANSWVTITSGMSGSGDGMVNFNVAANPFFRPRSSSILVQTSGASATHFITQAGDPDGILLGCDAIFFEVSEVEDDGDPDNILLIDPPRPKRVAAGAYLTPLVSPGIHTNGTQGSYQANYTLLLDLTDPSLSSISSVKLRYSVQAIGLSNGNSSTAGGGPYPSPAYNTTATLTIVGVDTITSHVEYAGGELFGPYNQTDSKTSGPFGPLVDIDITDQIGSIVEIDYFLDTNLFPDPIKGFDPNSIQSVFASQAGIDLTVICTA
ncbi:MAG: BACON domain-containing protein [Blastocatellia bacterium]